MIHGGWNEWPERPSPFFMCVSSKDLFDDGHVEGILHMGAGARGSLAQRRVDCKEIYLINVILSLMIIIIIIDYSEQSKSPPSRRSSLTAGLKLPFCTFTVIALTNIKVKHDHTVILHYSSFPL